MEADAHVLLQEGKADNRRLSHSAFHRYGAVAPRVWPFDLNMEFGAGESSPIRNFPTTPVSALSS